MKICLCCGCEIEWRKKWEDCWGEVRYCSDACRKNRYERRDGGLEEAILTLLASRASGATICPSEVARVYFGEEDWRPQMERVRCAARRLVALEQLQILQKSQPTDPSSAKGPIRLRLVR